MSDQVPPRKKMRKGTHSCLECRRRKLRCIFEANSPSRCKECINRQLKCIDQESADAEQLQVDSRQNLKERVGQLENVVQTLLARLDSGSPPGENTVSVHPTQAEASEPLSPTTSGSRSDADMLPNMHESAPVFSLFENALFTRHREQRADSDRPDALQRQQSHRLSPRNQKLRQHLLSLFPSREDLEVILSDSNDCWSSWVGTKMIEELHLPETLTLKQYVSQAIAEGGPAQISKALLCIAISISQMSSSDVQDCLNLSMSPQDLMEHYMSVIDTLVVSEDNLVGTLEGLECLILQMMWDVNLGRPRTAWLRCRRSLTFAQSLGLHRRASKPEQDMSASEQRGARIWWTLYHAERMLALILGVPYAVSDHHCDVQTMIKSRGEYPSTQIYRISLCVIIGRLIDRNQGSGVISLSTSLSIDQDLDELARSLPDEWWHPSLDSPTEGVASYDAAITKLWHHQVRALVHLPFMLKTSTDRRYEYSKIAAMDSSREMIKAFQYLRADAGARMYFCKVIDFQAFTAAMLLVINLLCDMYTRQNSSDRHEQDNKDWDLIYSTIGILRRASSEHGGAAALQAARALEMMCTARYGCNGEHRTAKVVIPYFGSVIVGSSKDVQEASQRHLAQLPTPSDSILSSHDTPREQNFFDFVAFDSYFDPTTSFASDQNNLQHAMPDASGNQSWNNMFNVDLDQDWSWYLNGEVVQ